METPDPPNVTPRKGPPNRWQLDTPADIPRSLRVDYYCQCPKGDLLSIFGTIKFTPLLETSAARANWATLAGSLKVMGLGKNVSQASSMM